MPIGNLLNKELFLQVAEGVKDKCAEKIKELTGGILEFGQLHVSSSLLTQGLIQSAIKMIPRSRAVLDDALCDDLLRLARDFTHVSLSAFYVEGAEKTAETLKNLVYIDQLAVWQKEFILRGGLPGVSDGESLEKHGALVSWARSYAENLAEEFVSEARMPSMKSRDGELPFSDTGIADHDSISDQTAGQEDQTQIAPAARRRRRK